MSDGSKQKLYYALLLKHLKAKHGYELGKDLFVLPFDWRIGIQGLMQVTWNINMADGFCLSDILVSAVPMLTTSRCAMSIPGIVELSVNWHAVFKPTEPLSMPYVCC